MGLSLFRSTSGCSCPASIPVNKAIKKLPAVRNPNPNPKNFKIEGIYNIGEFTILQVLYPDCTNYEGKKILVFPALSSVELANMQTLDPHFCDKHDKQLLARFVPTEQGLGLAKLFCQCVTGLPK